jgi:carbonic anhydrase/acetyltransferase-like protein (isoleucine patch superfamily)
METTVNATDTTVTEPATAPIGTTTAASPPGTRVRAGPVRIRHLGGTPWVHADAYVAPTAVLSGQVSIGAGSCIMHGAVLAAEGGPVQVGAGCVIMENAVLRGTVPHPLLLGDRALAGPHTQLTGASIAGEVFLAAGAMALPGAHLGRAATVGLGAIVHVGAIVAPRARIPAGWIAVGDPARIYPPGEAEPIAAGLAEAGWSFLHYVLRADDAGGRRGQLQAALGRYTAAMARHHRQDQIIPAPAAADDGAAPAHARRRRGRLAPGSVSGQPGAGSEGVRDARPAGWRARPAPHHAPPPSRRRPPGDPGSYWAAGHQALTATSGAPHNRTIGIPQQTEPSRP